MALRQLSLLYRNSLVILVLCCSVMAVGVDVIVVIVVVVVVVKVVVVTFMIVIRTKYMLHSRSISMKKIIKKHISPYP